MREPDAPVTLRVLGTLEADASGVSVRLGGPTQRAVLARILVAGAVPVSAERLVEDVWSGRASPDAVHPFVSRLRRVLGRDAIPQRRGGYVVDRDLVRVDADAFVAEVDDGRRALARGADAEAAVLLEAALARWRGERGFCGIADVRRHPGRRRRGRPARRAAGGGGRGARRRARPARPRWRGRRPAGRAGGALPAAGVVGGPAGRWRSTRRAARPTRSPPTSAAVGRLAEQLGVDPAPPLRRVHAAVLAQQALGAVSAAGPALRSNLPQRARAFVERPELAGVVEAALDDGGHRPVVLYGMPGAGKTELACELAHRRQRAGRVAWWIGAEDPAGTAAGLADLAAALGIGTRCARGGHPRRAVGRAGPGTGLGAGVRQRRRARAAGALPAHRGARRRHHHLPRPGLATAGPADPGAVADPRGVDHLRRRAQRRPGRRGRRRAGRAARRPSACPAAGLRLRRADRHDRARLRAPLPRTGKPSWVPSPPPGASRSTGSGGARRWPPGCWRRCRSSRPTRSPSRCCGRWPTATSWTCRKPSASCCAFRSSTARVRSCACTGSCRTSCASGSARRRAGARLDAAARICLAVDADERDAAAHLVQVAAHCEALRRLPLGLLDGLAAVARRFAERALYPAAEQVLTSALRLAGVQSGGAGTTIQRGTLLCQLGEVLDAAGRLDEALDLHRHAVELLDGEPEADELVLAHAYNRLGHVLNCADDTAGAVAAHERSLKTLRAVQRDDLVAPVLVDLGYTLWADGLLDRAEEALTTGRELMEPDSRGWAHATGGLGMVAQDRGLVEEAVDAAPTGDRPRSPGSAARTTPTPRRRWTSSATPCGSCTGPTEAIEQHRRAVALLVRVLGEEDTRVAMTLSNLGLALGDAGLAEAAIDTQTRAHQLFQAKLGPDARQHVDGRTPPRGRAGRGGSHGAGRAADPGGAGRARRPRRRGRARGDRRGRRARLRGRGRHGRGPRVAVARDVGRFCGTRPSCVCKVAARPVGHGVRLATPRNPPCARPAHRPPARPSPSRTCPPKSWSPRRGREGASRAWAEIVVRYERLVLGVVGSFRLQEADAADAAANTWLRAMEGLPALRDPDRLGGWLRTIARRECLGVLRHDRVRGAQRHRRRRDARRRSRGPRRSSSPARWARSSPTRWRISPAAAGS